MHARSQHFCALSESLAEGNHFRMGIRQEPRTELRRHLVAITIEHGGGQPQRRFDRQDRVARGKRCRSDQREVGQHPGDPERVEFVLKELRVQQQIGEVIPSASSRHV